MRVPQAEGRGLSEQAMAVAFETANASGWMDRVYGLCFCGLCLTPKISSC